ncbi:MAG: patatin-like phospholipase family protein [Prevotella sp.]|nr:patatin-like phospholipase family protein [Prevotella sp.]
MEDIGLVFGGGGAKGAYQIGVWNTMRICGADKYVKAVSGTSVGALNAVLFALGDYDKARYIWETIGQFDVTAPKFQFTDGFFSRSGLEETIDSLNLQKLQNSKINVYITVKHINDKNLIDKIFEWYLRWGLGPLSIFSPYLFFLPKNIHLSEVIRNLGKGEIYHYHINSMEPSKIKDIMLASTAMAIIYNSVQVDGKRSIDAGLTQFDNVPIKPLYERDFRNIWVVPLDGKYDLQKIKTSAFSDFNAYKEYKDCNFTVIKPSESLGGTLIFSKKLIEKRFKLGEDDAIEALRGMFF